MEHFKNVLALQNSNKVLLINSCSNRPIQDDTVSLALFIRISGILKRTLGFINSHYHFLEND